MKNKNKNKIAKQLYSSTANKIDENSGPCVELPKLSCSWASQGYILQMYLEHTTLITSVGVQDVLRDYVAIQETLCFPEKTGQHPAVIGKSSSGFLTQGSPSSRLAASVSADQG